MTKEATIEITDKKPSALSAMKLSNIPSLKSLERTGNTKTKFKSDKINHALSFPRMR
jgi:hypothetical protein